MMPRGDGTGPWGEGPVSGRRWGMCRTGPAPVPGPWCGRGRGRGGRGPGWAGRRASRRPGARVATVAPPPLDEKTALKGLREGLRTQLEVIEKRLQELEEA